MTNIECVGNPERVKNISCNLKAVNWTRAIANMDCYLPVPLYNPVVSAVIVDRNSGISEYVGTVKFYLQSMLPVKNKKRPRPKAQES
ncbi:GL14517 [Drosophila persimilis]|uniref:GL14517 n=1 Tax=Drosophila persimilis TaxID=7234 RepID=B4IRP3_DROPE|nr:GL14517 [Drosophila persimilis]